VNNSNLHRVILLQLNSLQADPNLFVVQMDKVISELSRSLMVSGTKHASSNFVQVL